MRPNPTEKRCDKTKSKGKSPKGLRMRIVSAILRSFMGGRERGITPLPSFLYSTPYNQTPSVHPLTPTIKHPNIPYTTHRLIPLSLIRPITRFLVSLVSTMFSIPFIHNIPPNCATPSVSPPEPPPLSPYLQSYIRRATTTPSTPTIHYPYAYSLNTFLIVLFSYSLFIPPNCPTL